LGEGGAKATGATLLATIPGVYSARFHNIPDDCGHILATIPGVPDETYKVDLETLELVEK